MAKRWISHIMSKTGSTDYGAEFSELAVSQLRMSLHKSMPHIIAQTSAHARHLQRMGQPVVHKHTARQRKDLSLVLQTAKGS